MRVIVLVILSLALILDVKAISVASDFYVNNTLYLTEGTSTFYNIELQNPEPFELSYKVSYDDAYMKAIDLKEEYILPPKTTEGIRFNVTAPKYNKKNNEFTLGFTVHQTSGAGGGIGFLPKVSKNFKLKVVEDPNRFHINYFYVAYVIILLTIIFFLLRKKK